MSRGHGKTEVGQLVLTSTTPPGNLGLYAKDDSTIGVVGQLACVDPTTKVISDVVTSTVDPLTGVSTYSAGGNSLFFGGSGNNIAFISDSRFRTAIKDTFASVSVPNSFGMSCDWLGTGPDVASGVTGTLEYSAGPAAYRWTAPSDTAGPWTPIVVGRMDIQSATANKQISVIVKNMNSPAASGGSTTVTTSGTLPLSRFWLSAFVDVISRYRNGPISYNLAASGAHAADIVSMLPWYARTITGAGVDVFRFGVNDISSGTAAAAIFASAKQVFDARIAAGRSLVICGEPARWGVDTSTAMTAGQLSALVGYNKMLADYAASRSTCCRFVDLYAISRDPAYVDGRPAAGILTDTVHDAQTGAIAFGAAIKAAIDSLGLCSAAPYPQPGDQDVIFNSASTWLHTTGGSLGTGVSGTSSTGVIVDRISGSDLTAVSSITGYSDHNGKRVQVDITSVTANNVLGISSVLPVNTPTLAEMGLSVGDRVWFECDIEVVSGAPTFILAVVSVAGGGRGTRVYCATTPGVYHCVSESVVLLANDTTIRQAVQITMPASATATLKVGEFVTRKVTA